MRPRTAIVGAGIGGLTLALALRERGVPVEVFEQAGRLSEIGAAVALSANATRVLERLGVGERLATVSAEPTELILRHWRSGERVAAHPVGNGGWYRGRYGAPYYGVHRKDLQAILGAAWGTEGLYLGRALTDLEDGPDGVRLTFADGTTAEAGVVVGADGIRSTVRRWLTGADETVFSGTSGFRGIVPVDRLPSLPDPAAIQFWMGPGAHLLHYAIGADADQVNFLAVVEGPRRWADPTVWRADATDSEALAAFDGWHPAVTELVGSVSHRERWGLFGVRALDRWSRGRVVLLGDAAHGMLPHQGQGANQTIEDAALLAELLVGDESPASAFDRYERLRRPRTRRVQGVSWLTNRILHLPDGAQARERDHGLAALPSTIGWIHEHDVLAGLRTPAS
jgi:salicylate hydroxylase